MSILSSPRIQAFDNNGTVVSGAKLYFYEAGTSTPKDTYSDSALTTTNANPVVADASGWFGPIYMSGDYKITLANASDVTIWSQDNVSSLAEGVFTPSATGAVERTIQSKFDEWVSVTDFGAVADYSAGGGTDNFAAFQAAIDTGKNVYVPRGSYRLDNAELIFTTQNQAMYGDGGGYVALKDPEDAHWSSRLVFTGTGDEYIQTRRAAPENSGDAQDNPLSAALNCQAEGVKLQSLFVDLYCDYSDTTATNLGADYDVGFLNGTRVGVQITDVCFRGYWRFASILGDVTRGIGISQFTSDSGTAFPAGTIANGMDRMYLRNVIARGGLKGLYVRGALESASGDYYDHLSSTIVSNHAERGGVGASDFEAQNCAFAGRDHHSGVRAYDPQSTLNPDNEDLETISAGIVIDGRRGVASQGRIRKMRFSNCRVETFESARVFLGRSHEIYLEEYHDEPIEESVSGGSIYATDGSTVVDPTDTSSSGDSYKGIAAVATSGTNVGSDEIHLDQPINTPDPDWFQNVVTNNSVVLNPVSDDNDTETANWRLVTVSMSTETLSVRQMGKWRLLSLELAWTGLDTGDTSEASIGALSDVDSTLAERIVLSINRTGSTGIDWTDADAVGLQLEGWDDSGTTRLRAVNESGTAVSYDDGVIQASGSLFATGIVYDT